MCVCVLFLSPQRKKKKTQKRKKNGGFSRLRKFLFFFFFSYFLLLEGLGEDNFFFFSSVVSMDPTLFVVIRTNLLGIIIIGVVESSKQCSFSFFSFFLSCTWSFVVVKRNFSYWISKSIKRTQDTGVVFFHIHFCLPFYDTLQQLRLVLRYFARHSFFSHFVSYYHW